MICKNCSAEFDGKFCPDCGTPAEIAEPVAEAPVVESPAVEEKVELPKVVAHRKSR